MKNARSVVQAKIDSRWRFWPSAVRTCDAGRHPRLTEPIADPDMARTPPDNTRSGSGSSSGTAVAIIGGAVRSGFALGYYQKMKRKAIAARAADAAEPCLFWAAHRHIVKSTQGVVHVQRHRIRPGSRRIWLSQVVLGASQRSSRSPCSCGPASSPAQQQTQPRSEDTTVRAAETVDVTGSAILITPPLTSITLSSAALLGCRARFATVARYSRRCGRRVRRRAATARRWHAGGPHADVEPSPPLP